MHLKYIITVFFPSNNWHPQQIALRRDFLWPSWTLSNIFSYLALLLFCFTEPLPLLLCSAVAIWSAVYTYISPVELLGKIIFLLFFVLSSVMLNPMNDLLLFTLKVDTFQCNFACHIYSLWKSGKLKSDFQSSTSYTELCSCPCLPQLLKKKKKKKDFIVV